MRNLEMIHINEEELGQGPNSSVHSYIDIYNDKQWVVKKIKAEDSRCFLKVMRGIVHSFNLDHPNIVTVKNHHVEPLENKSYNVYIQMLRMEENFESFRDKKKEENEMSINKEVIIKVFNEVLTALEYLHKRELAHGNIKPTNILFDTEGKARLSDIGFTYVIPEGESLDSIFDELYYQSPEKIVALKNDIECDLEKADIWSLGMVIAESILGKSRLIEPIATLEEKEEAIKKIIEEIKEKDFDGLGSLVENMIAFQSDDRLDLSQIRKKLENDFKEIVAVEVLTMHRMIFKELGKRWKRRREGKRERKRKEWTLDSN